MRHPRVINIKERPELRQRLSRWFQEKWGIPADLYLQSIDEALRGDNPIPQWYLAVAEDEIIGGMGVIENDFHDRKDLAPNVCAVFVEEEYRGQGIAGEMLHFVCRDMQSHHVNTLYLVTDHESFYERYGWHFLGMVRSDGADEQSRIYVHTAT
ncbi:GNAT family N-acetyltransferase [Aeromonas diversa]|uniref:GNAT family N-acetyltransferase n=1 Tax=Aeromonas diversa TaxID=502790 RepID=UPI00399FA0C0